MHDLGQRDRVDELDPLGRQVLHPLISPRVAWHRSMIVPVYSAGVMMVACSTGSSMWSMFCGAGSSEGLSTRELGPVGQVGDVLDRRGGRDEREVELALEAFADDVHVQQPEEPATEAEAEGGESRARR